jgi:glycosyltransferase involved in cell wall biosynthesis
MAPLRVIINAQLPLDGSGGGVQQFTTALIRALGKLDDGPEEYIIVGTKENNGRLSEFLGPNQRLVRGPQPSSISRSIGKLLGPLKNSVAAAHLALKKIKLDSRLIRIPKSNGFFESFGASLIHFPYQGFWKTSLPFVYNPHDLLHLNYPRLLPIAEVAYREVLYRLACTTSHTVAAESQWARKDIIQRYRIDPEKAVAILRGSPTVQHEDISEETLVRVRQQYGLSDAFALYPAQTWPHKNHLRLIEAIKMLRDKKGTAIQVVCVGHKNSHWPVIEQHIRAKNVTDLFRFPGFVPEADLRALYRLALFVVFPSLFEGGGFPVLEAFSEGTPLACSTAASLPEYAGQAALFFDPISPESIADGMRQIVRDDHLRSILIAAGTERTRLYEWKTTAKTYRAVYRRTAGLNLSDEDIHLLTRTTETPKSREE